jgi:tetratricopeptide (TPR) repeat protein
MSRRKVKRKIITQKHKEKDNSAQAKVLASRRNILILLISLSLIVVTITAFGQLRNHTFLNYDDDFYITKNRHIQSGLTLEGVIWAFTTMYAANWHPLTWLSHMLDCQLYGLSPSGHHLTNLVFHIASSLLLFFVLEQMTGALWRSGFVAALFALHPLHVESVAWVAERKDVLSTFFWMLTMWAYVRYSERQGFSRYLLVLLFFTLGLLSKPMLVTLPFVLLLLDYWPLGRFQFGQLSDDRKSHTSESMSSDSQKPIALHLVREKAPLFVLCAVSSVLTIFAQQKGEAVISLVHYPLESRIANALVSYVSYIGKMIWPWHLAVFYPYQEMLPIWKVVGSGLLLVCVSLLVIRTARKLPYLVVGWFWYIGTLIPVIGLVKVGLQAMADRYTYVPLIGLFIMIVWGVPGVLVKWRHRILVLSISAALLLSFLVIVTKLQVKHWQNGIALFEHSLEMTPNNFLMHNNLGVALANLGRNEEAIAHYVEAVRIKPDFAEAYNNLGQVLTRQGRIQEAIAHYTKALQINPNYTQVHKNLGRILAHQGKNQEAIVHYTEALRIDPSDAEAHNNLGLVLTRQGRFQEAIIHITEALRIEPDYAEIYINLGNIFLEQGKIEEAIPHYTKALRIKPNFAAAHFSLCLAYLKMGDRSSALKEYEILKTINPDLANNLYQKISK